MSFLGLGNISGSVASIVSIFLTGIVLFLANFFVGLGLGSNYLNVDVGAPAPTTAAVDSGKRKQLRSNVNRISAGLRSTDFDLDLAIDCARDVFVTLHRKDAEGGNGRACKGLLIRDDIIITSEECSKFGFTFDFAGFGPVLASPHPSLNSAEEMIGSRLGFLEAHPPYHRRFSGQRTRRTRMFLSKRPNPGPKGDKNSEAAVISCGEGQKPIAHNFPVDGDMVPLGQLRDVLPEDILWEDKDLRSAVTLQYKNHSWWTKPVTLEEEEAELDQLLDERYRGPPGSISLHDAGEDYIDIMVGLLEALDPRGHRHLGCFENYFVRYRGEEPFSGMHFFDWLDFGSGKFLLERAMIEASPNGTLRYMTGDIRCHRRDFVRDKVYYFTDEERARYEVDVAPSTDGRELIARYKHDGRRVSKTSMDDPHLYMWGLDEKLYIIDDTWDEEKRGEVKHSGIMAAGPALSAGEVYLRKRGRIWGINFNSGHYEPGIQALSLMYQWMKNQNFNLTALHWVGLTVDDDERWSAESCEEYDWSKVELPGYNGAELNASCHEVTSSPSWVSQKDIRKQHVM